MKAEDVPAGPVLVDTDVVSYWTNRSGRGDEFRSLLNGHELAISFATYGELLAIPHKLNWGDRRLTELRGWLSRFVVVPSTAAIAENWARMHAKVSGQLHQGGTNDLWTAACALALTPALPLATNNLGDFQTIAKESRDCV